jgi:hypothetical protein
MDDPTRRCENDTDNGTRLLGAPGPKRGPQFFSGPAGLELSYLDFDDAWLDSRLVSFASLLLDFLQDQFEMNCQRCWLREPEMLALVDGEVPPCLCLLVEVAD